jgi:hypothetical protein
MVEKFDQTDATEQAPHGPAKVGEHCALVGEDRAGDRQLIDRVDGTFHS